MVASSDKVASERWPLDRASCRAAPDPWMLKVAGGVLQIGTYSGTVCDAAETSVDTALMPAARDQRTLMIR